MPTTTKSLRDHVGEMLPEGGPYTVERTETAALLLPELVRYLNHATVTDRDAAEALPYPSTASSVIAATHLLAERLQQLLGQLADREDVYAADPTLRANGAEVAPAVLAGVVAEDLRDAAQAAGDLAHRLRQVHNDAARLSAYVPWDDDEDDLVTP